MSTPGEARSDAKGLTQELKSHNIRAVSSMNDLTIEMTVDGSSECAKRRDSIPWFVEGEDIMVSPLDTTPFSGTETEGEGTEDAEKTIRLLLKCAYSARRVSEGNDNLNQDLGQLISNLRKLDDDRTDECGVQTLFLEKETAREQEEKAAEDEEGVANAQIIYIRSGRRC